MSARPLFRYGSAFEEASDLLVIPCSTHGEVVSYLLDRLLRDGYPGPPDELAPGGVHLRPLEGLPFKHIAYAASVENERSSPALLQQLGDNLGKASDEVAARQIASPLMGAGAGGLTAPQAVVALWEGFVRWAQRSQLTISLPSHNLVYTVQEAVDAFEAELGASVAPEPDPPARGGDTNPPARPSRTGVFISYCHKDRPWLLRLQTHLAPLQRAGIAIWDDTQLEAGDAWQDEIREAMATARIAILLITADFLASKFITTEELPPLLAAAEDDGAIIVPLIVSPSAFTRTPGLARFHAINDPAKPLVKMRHASREAVLDEVARRVEEALAS